MENQLRSWFQQPAVALAPMPIAALAGGKLVAGNNDFTDRFGAIDQPVDLQWWMEQKGFELSEQDKESWLRPQPRTQVHLHLPSKLAGGSPQVFRCDFVQHDAGTHFLYFHDESASYYSRHQGLAQRQYLDGVLAATSFFLIRVDMQGRYTYANESFLKTFGYDMDTLRNTEVRCTVMEEDYAEMMDATMQSIAFPGKKIVTVLRKPLPRKGEFVTTQWEFVTVADATGRPVEVQCAGINISQQAAVQQRFAQAQARMQQSIERMKKLISTHADDSDKREGSQALIKSLESELNELQQMPIEAPQTSIRPFNLPSYQPFGG